MLNNIDKKLEAIGNNEESKRLADLEKIEFDVMQNLADTIKEDFERETKDKPMTFMDWLKSKDEMHEVLIYKLLSEEKQIKNLKVMTINSTTKLNVKQMNDYIKKVQDFARGYGFKLGEEEIKD